MFLEAGMPSGSLSAPVYAKIIQAAELRAHELGWQLSLRHKQNGESLKEALRNFQGGGIILFGKSVVYDELQSVIPGVPAVRLLAPPASRLDCDNVDYDRLEMPRIAARELHSKGCRQVAYIGPDDARADLFLEEAARLGMTATDVRQDGIFSARGSVQIVNREALQAAFEKIMSRMPDGLFVHSDNITNSLYPLFAKNRIKPGKDIRIVSCNADELFLSALHPRPSSIDIHPGEIGRRGVDQLLWRIENKEAPPSTVIIRPQLVPGEEA
jgi:DNA-binding LacI/PurR family transcriptional regulator